MASGPTPRDLSDDALSGLLSNQQFGALATVNSHGYPHVTTMIYAWDPSERMVRFLTTAERVKVKHVRNNPRAALHVAGPDVWSFAVAEGDATVSDVTRAPGDAVGREIWAMMPASIRPDDQDAFYRELVEEHRVVIRLQVHRLYGAALDQT